MKNYGSSIMAVARSRLRGRNRVFKLFGFWYVTCGACPWSHGYLNWHYAWLGLRDHHSLAQTQGRGCPGRKT